MTKNKTEYYRQTYNCGYCRNKFDLIRMIWEWSSEGGNIKTHARPSITKCPRCKNLLPNDSYIEVKGASQKEFIEFIEQGI